MGNFILFKVWYKVLYIDVFIFEVEDSEILWILVIFDKYFYFVKKWRVVNI